MWSLRTHACGGCRCGLADLLLSVSSLLIIVVGSYQLVRCLRKKIKTAAKMSKQMRAGKSKPTDKKKVHPVGRSKKAARVHPLGKDDVMEV